MNGWTLKITLLKIRNSPEKTFIFVFNMLIFRGVPFPRKIVHQQTCSQKKTIDSVALVNSLSLQCFYAQHLRAFLPFFFWYFPKDHWTLKTGYFEDPNPAIQVQTLPLEGPRSLGFTKKQITLPETNSSHLKMDGWKTILSHWESNFSGAMLNFRWVRRFLMKAFFL